MSDSNNHLAAVFRRTMDSLMAEEQRGFVNQRNMVPGAIFPPAPEECGPWFLRWTSPGGAADGEVQLRDIDPKADPMDHEAAQELARWMVRRYPHRLWWVSNRSKGRIISP